MLRLSTKTRYGVRAIFDIAYHSGNSGSQAKEISRRQGISSGYLEQIFHRLKKAGILRTKRGPAGGYFLARKPEDITVGQIVRITEGSLEPAPCVNLNNPGFNCDRIDNCVTRFIWKEAGQRLEEYLDSVTIQDLCDRARVLGLKDESSENLMYYI